MTDEAIAAGSSRRTPARVEEVDAGWLDLQRVVAVGMIVVLVTPMVVVLQRLIPPLAIASVLFAIALALTWLRPRAGAIAVGVLAGLWVLLQLATLSMVIPNLARPSATLFFLVTFGMLVFGGAGVVGLVGVLWRAPGRIAVRTVQLVVAVLLGGLALSVMSNV